MKSKLKSRKFWLSVASILASIGTSISGICIDNQDIVIAGVICTVLSSSIYSIIEGINDNKGITVNTDNSDEI